MAQGKALPNGRIVGTKEFRAAKAAQGKSEEDAKAAAELQVFKKRRLNERVLKENAVAEAQLVAGAIKSAALMAAFVRARTNKPVGEKGDALKKIVGELRNKPISIRPAGAGARGLPSLAADCAEG